VEFLVHAGAKRKANSSGKLSSPKRRRSSTLRVKRSTSVDHMTRGLHPALVSRTRRKIRSGSPRSIRTRPIQPARRPNP